MRLVPIVLLALLALPCAAADAQPLSERIVAPPPPAGMPPRAGTYADPFAARPQFDFTVKPQRPVKKRKSQKRYR